MFSSPRNLPNPAIEPRSPTLQTDPLPAEPPGSPKQTEAEDIKKRWQEYTEELYKKELRDPDNHNHVITHLEPDILECKVKWALRSITTKKVSGDDKIPVELFQILQDDAVICQYVSKFGKLSSGHRTGKDQFSFQSQRKEMPRNVQTTTQLYLPHMLGK